MIITANELKVKGVSFFADILEKFQAATISVHGKAEYILLTKKEYDRLYQQETLLALQEARNDIANGKYTTNVSDHLNNVCPQ